MSGPVRTSSGLHAFLLAGIRKAVADALTADHRHDLSAGQIETAAGKATRAAHDPLAAMFKAGVAAGRLAVYLLHQLAPPPGDAPSCYCPHCGGEITVAAPPLPPPDAADTRKLRALAPTAAFERPKR